MSAEATGWAIGQQVGDATRKLILWGLANHADKDGYSAYPSVATLAEYAECSVRTVRRHLPLLLEAGYIREGAQEVARAWLISKGKDPKYAPIVYDVAMSDDRRDQWAAAYAVGANADRRRQAAATGAMRPSTTQGDEGQGAESRGDNLTGLGVDSDLPNGESRPDTGGTPDLPNEAVRPDTAMSGKPSLETELLKPEEQTNARDPFDEFWSAYPRKDDKVSARTVWTRITTRKDNPVDPQVIVDGARRYAADPNREDPFTKRPTTWLNAGSWENGPLPSRMAGRAGKAVPTYTDALHGDDDAPVEIDYSCFDPPSAVGEN